jgi:hypothetical protein
LVGWSSKPNFLPHAIFSDPCPADIFSFSRLVLIFALCQVSSLALVNDVLLLAMGQLASGSLGHFTVAHVDQATTSCY